MRHALKTWPEYFKAVVSGVKNFEVRREDDRKFKVGDRLLLQEFDPKKPAGEQYTGNEHEVEVTYILRGPGFGITENHVVMGLKEKLW